ncbi:hypothetical protein ADUPG1_002915, partial [Aduncisulcus paluster]
ASGCNLSAVSDVLDLTPIADGDSATQPFKLTSLDLSDNSISDVSVLITSGLFPADTLTFLDISGNSICDIDAAVTTLQSYFTNTVAIVSSGQSTCPCSDDVSFTSFETCKQRSDGTYQVQCWNGYYLDKETNSCVEASTTDQSIRCQVCESIINMQTVLESGSSSITCECGEGWFGDNCSSRCPVNYGMICSNHGSCNDSEHICECDSGYSGDACSTLVVTYSSDCARSFTIEDHMTCQEVSSGRYAAECDDGYYYDEASYSCVEDTLSQCSSYIDGHRMCVLPDDGSTAPSLGCRSVWYGDECDDMYSVHIPDKV